MQKSRNLPGCFVLLDREDGVLHGLVTQRVHRGHEKVQGQDQLLTIFTLKVQAIYDTEKDS